MGESSSANRLVAHLSHPCIRSLTLAAGIPPRGLPICRQQWPDECFLAVGTQCASVGKQSASDSPALLVQSRSEKAIIESRSRRSFHMPATRNAPTATETACLSGSVPHVVGRVSNLAVDAIQELLHAERSPAKARRARSGLFVGCPQGTGRRLLSQFCFAALYVRAQHPLGEQVRSRESRLVAQTACGTARGPYPSPPATDRHQ